ncbi:hypothetical protein FACS18945_3170 [Bacteroidia bacterium]|nr:hypothetical protein FACS18945_3170 [Bacteroidia bacterium]
MVKACDCATLAEKVDRARFSAASAEERLNAKTDEKIGNKIDADKKNFLCEKTAQELVRCVCVCVGFCGFSRLTAFNL